MRERSVQCIERLHISDDGKGEGRTRIKVVCWVIDGKEYKPVLEKRGYYTGQNGEELTGKMKGLKIADLEKIKEKWDEIMEAMK